MAVSRRKKQGSAKKKATQPQKKSTRPRKRATPGQKKAARPQKKAVSRPKKVASRPQKKEPPKIQKKAIPPKEVYQLYERAVRWVYQKKHQEARSLFHKIRDKFPSELEVLDRVNTFLEICEGRLQKREKGSPSTAEEFFDHGVMDHNRGLHEKALESFSAALKLAKKDSGFIHYAMAAAEVSLGNHEEALKSLKRSIQIQEDHRFFAQNDPDFEPLMRNEEFQELVRSPREP